MEKVSLKINDFALFADTVQNMVRISGNAKITVTKNGFESAIADDNEIIRLDVESDAIALPSDCAEESVVLCSKSLAMISQVLQKISKSHTKKLKKDSAPDYSDVSIHVDDTTLYVKSAVLKTNVFLDNEQSIHSINPFKRSLNTIAEVVVSNDEIKDVISSTFIFKQSDKIIIDIGHQDDMVRNIAYAFMSDPNDPRSNDMVIKFGNIISGDFTRKVLVDTPKIKYLSMFPVDTMTVKFNNEPCFCAYFDIGGNSSGSVTKYRVMGKYVVPKKIASA